MNANCRISRDGIAGNLDPLISCGSKIFISPISCNLESGVLYPTCIRYCNCIIRNVNSGQSVSNSLWFGAGSGAGSYIDPTPGGIDGAAGDLVGNGSVVRASDAFKVSANWPVAA